MKTAVIGILYKRAEPFLLDYFKSIAAQLGNNFSLYLFNNHEDEEYDLGPEADCVKEKGIPITVYQVPRRPRPISFVREYINRTLNEDLGIENIIFTDCDDVFDEKRFQLVLEALKDSDMVFNDIPPFYSKPNEGLASPFDQRPIDQIGFEEMLDYNVMGFLNTGVRASVLRNAFPIVTTSTSCVNDWFLFCGLLAQGYTATFVKGAVTHYRQHSNNTVGLKRRFTASQITFGITVKKNHYQRLLVHISGEKQRLVQEKLKGIEKLEKQLEQPGFMDKYLIHVNAAADNQLFHWWEWIDEKFL